MLLCCSSLAVCVPSSPCLPASLLFHLPQWWCVSESRVGEGGSGRRTGRSSRSRVGDPLTRSLMITLTRHPAHTISNTPVQGTTPHTQQEQKQEGRGGGKVAQEGRRRGNRQSRTVASASPARPCLLCCCFSSVAPLFSYLCHEFPIVVEPVPGGEQSVSSVQVAVVGEGGRRRIPADCASSRPVAWWLRINF